MATSFRALSDCTTLTLWAPSLWCCWEGARIFKNTYATAAISMLSCIFTAVVITIHFMRYYRNHSDIGQQADQYSAHVPKLILTWELDHSLEVSHGRLTYWIFCVSSLPDLNPGRIAASWQDPFTGDPSKQLPLCGGLQSQRPSLHGSPPSCSRSSLILWVTWSLQDSAAIPLLKPH